MSLDEFATLVELINTGKRRRLKRILVIAASIVAIIAVSLIIVYVGVIK